MNSLATTNERTDQLFLAISMITDSKIQELKYDQTIEGTIKSDADKQNDCYVVTTEHAAFEAYAINNAKYTVGEAVYVQIPSGDYSKQKFIIGRKVDPNNEDGKPFKYTTPLSNFITFEDLTLETIPTLPKAYKANKPEDGEITAASEAYVNAMTKLTLLWNTTSEQKDAELTSAKTYYERSIADLVDRNGNVIGSAGEDANNIEILLDPNLSESIIPTTPGHPKFLTVLATGANRAHLNPVWYATQSAVPSGTTNYKVIYAYYKTLFGINPPSTKEDTPVWSLKELEDCIYKTDVFDQQERIGILKLLWDTYWNSSDLLIQRDRLADRLAEYDRLTSLYNDQVKLIEDKYEQEFNLIQLGFKIIDDKNQNILAYIDEVVLNKGTSLKGDMYATLDEAKEAYKTSHGYDSSKPETNKDNKAILNAFTKKVSALKKYLDVTTWAKILSALNKTGHALEIAAQGLSDPNSSGLSAINHNLLWLWTRGERSSSIICTKLGIQSTWVVLLGGYAPKAGTYGLRLEITGVTKATESQPSELKQQTLYFKSNLMYGNPYSFLQPRNLLIVFDISKFNEIKSIAIYFWQDHNFVDLYGLVIPYVNVNNNIKIKGLEVKLGMTADEVADELVFIYTYDRLSFGSNPLIVNNTGDLDLNKKLDFIWVHREGDEYILINTPEKLKQYNGLIYWYKYDTGVEINSANAPERYAGANYRLLVDRDPNHPELDTYSGVTLDFEKFCIEFSQEPTVVDYTYKVRQLNNELAAIDAKVLSGALLESFASVERARAHGTWDVEIRIAEELARARWEELKNILDFNKFSINVLLDPEKRFERFRAAIAYDGGYRITDIITFSNLDTTLGDSPTSDADFVFKLFRRGYVVDKNTGEFTYGSIEEDPGRDSFFVYDENSIAIKDQAGCQFSSIDWYIQIWMKNQLTHDYIPLMVNDEVDDHLLVTWNIPLKYTMFNFSSFSTISTTEAAELSGLFEDTLDIRDDLKELYVFKTTRKFRIERMWDITKTNNTLEATIVRLGHTYHISKQFFFGKSGTDGSEWTVVIHQEKPEHPGIESASPKFKLSAEILDRYGQRAESAGYSFMWELLSPTIITETSAESISGYTWLQSQWITTESMNYGNYIGNSIEGFVRDGNPPIFKVTVTNCASYPLTAYMSCMLTNAYVALVKDWNYSLPYRVEFKANGESPNYLASPFLRWQSLNGEENYDYPVWTLHQEQRNPTTNTWTVVDPPLFFRLTEDMTYSLDLTSNQNINLDRSVNRAVNRVLATMISNYNWPSMNTSKTYTYDEALEYIKDLEQLAADYYLTQSQQDDAILAQLNEAIRQAKYEINHGAGKIRDGFVEYTLDPYIDPTNGKLRTTWAWIEDMDTDYYTYIGFENEHHLYVRLAIVCCRNVYSSSLINAWDGNLLIDEENNAIMAKMISAGVKDNYNRFNGVLMGDWSGNADSSLSKVGLYGFNAGAQVFGFRNDATGFIGKAGKGQIQFNGKYSLISNYDKTCYLNLDPILFNQDGDFTPGSYRGYSQYFLYAKLPRSVNTELVTTLEETQLNIEKLESTVYWAKQFFNDPNNDYFVVDPNNGVLTTGGVVASYGKIGNWMIGKHGMYQYFSGAGLSTPPIGSPPNSRYMYLGYNVKGGYLDDPNVIALYKAKYYTGKDSSKYANPDIGDSVRQSYDGEYRWLRDSDFKTEDNSELLIIRALYRVITIEHLIEMDRLNALGRNLHETVEMLFEMLAWLKEQVHDGIRDLPTTVYTLDPYHYMNYGWGMQYVAGFIDELLEEKGMYASSEEYANWILENAHRIFNKTTYANSYHYHYRSDGSVEGTYSTGWQHTMGPILGFARKDSNTPQRSPYSGNTYSTTTAFGERVTVHTLSKNIWPLNESGSITGTLLKLIQEECLAGYEIFLSDCYTLLMSMYYAAIEADTIPQTDWDYMRENWPGFFTLTTSQKYDATVLKLINRANEKYELNLQELYAYDNEHKYAIYCGYYPDWDVLYENNAVNNSLYSPLFTVNWRGYMTARAGKIGLTSPWYITDYGLTLTNNFGTIYIGDPSAPSDKRKWLTIMSRDRKNLKLCPNNEVTNNEQGNIAGPMLALINDNNGQLYMEISRGFFAIYGGIPSTNDTRPENGVINFGIRLDGTIYARKGLIGGWNISPTFLGHYVPILRTVDGSGNIVSETEVLIDANTGELLKNSSTKYTNAEIQEFENGKTVNGNTVTLGYHKNVELNGRTATIILGTLLYNAKLSIAGFDIKSDVLNNSNQDELMELLAPTLDLIPIHVTRYQWHAIDGGANGQGNIGTSGYTTEEEIRAYIQDLKDKRNALIRDHDNNWDYCKTYTIDRESIDINSLSSSTLLNYLSQLEDKEQLLETKLGELAIRMQQLDEDDPELSALYELRSDLEDDIASLNSLITTAQANYNAAIVLRDTYQAMIDNGGAPSLESLQGLLADKQQDILDAQALQQSYLDLAASLAPPGGEDPSPAYNDAIAEAERIETEVIPALQAEADAIQALIDDIINNGLLTLELIIAYRDQWLTTANGYSDEITNLTTQRQGKQDELRQVNGQIKTKLNEREDRYYLDDTYVQLVNQIALLRKEINKLNSQIEAERSRLYQLALEAASGGEGRLYYGWPKTTANKYYLLTNEDSLSCQEITFSGGVTPAYLNTIYFNKTKTSNTHKTGYDAVLWKLGKFIWALLVDAEIVENYEATITSYNTDIQYYENFLEGSDPDATNNVVYPVLGADSLAWNFAYPTALNYGTAQGVPGSQTMVGNKLHFTNNDNRVSGSNKPQAGFTLAIGYQLDSENQLTGISVPMITALLPKNSTGYLLNWNFSGPSVYASLTIYGARAIYLEEEEYQLKKSYDSNGLLVVEYDTTKPHPRKGHMVATLWWVQIITDALADRIVTVNNLAKRALDTANRAIELAWKGIRKALAAAEAAARAAAIALDALNRTVVGVYVWTEHTGGGKAGVRYWARTYDGGFLTDSSGSNLADAWHSHDAEITIGYGSGSGTVSQVKGFEGTVTVDTSGLDTYIDLLIAELLKLIDLLRAAFNAHKHMAQGYSLTTTNGMAVTGVNSSTSSAGGGSIGAGGGSISAHRHTVYTSGKSQFVATAKLNDDGNTKFTTGPDLTA